MDKNENGYPGMPPAGGNGNTGGMMPPQNGGMGGNGTTQNHHCGGRGDCMDNMPLAYVYAPNQFFRMLYSASEALNHGTLFEELYKPMEVYGNE